MDIIYNFLVQRYKYNPNKIKNIFHKLDDSIIELAYEQKMYMKSIVKSLPKHRDDIYYNSDNIISLCSEYNFAKTSKNKNYIFPKKLKLLFDIKNENDIEKCVQFYLCNENN